MATARATTQVPPAKAGTSRRMRVVSPAVRATKSRSKAAPRKPLTYTLPSGKVLVAKPGSALEGFLELGIVGSAKGLPSDLSTNKKYMEGFGESREKRPR